MIDISHILARVDAMRGAFGKQSGEYPVEVQPRSILTDIMHWCNDAGLDFDHELSLATDMFADERELTPREREIIDAAWEKHKAAKP
jgi:hypothetical protein